MSEDIAQPEIYAFQMKESDLVTPTSKSTPWRVVLHKVLVWRALQIRLEGGPEYQSGCWMLKKVDVGGVPGLSVAAPLNIARKEWADNVPRNIKRPAGLGPA